MASFVRPSLIFFLVLVACGARSPLDGLGVGSDGSGPGGGAIPDGGTISDSGTVPITAPTCAKWGATQPPVQVSNPAGIIGLQTALATPTGVLVGYADIEFPPKDPTWHVRRVSYDGALGPPNVVFHRDTTKLGWTAVSLAQGAELAAIAWDETQGLMFTRLDATGAPTEAVTRNPGNPGRALAATPGTFTMLRSPFDGFRSPVSLVSFAALGHPGEARVLVSAMVTETIDPVTRAVYADGSFLLIWAENGPCGLCHGVYVQHFSQAGDPLGARGALPGMGLGGVAFAPSSQGVLFAWVQRSGASPLSVVTSPRDPDGKPLGADLPMTPISGQSASAIAMGTAPGGDAIVAWTEVTGGQHSELFVQSVAATGEAEGPPVSLGTIVADTNQTLRVVASAEGAMVLFEQEVPNVGSQVFAIPLRCAPQH